MSEVLCDQRGEPTHADTRLALDGTVVGETRTLGTTVRWLGACEGMSGLPYDTAIPGVPDGGREDREQVGFADIHGTGQRQTMYVG